MELAKETTTDMIWKNELQSSKRVTLKMRAEESLRQLVQGEQGMVNLFENEVLIHFTFFCPSIPI